MSLVPDFETKILLDIHDRLLPNPTEWKKLETIIRDRVDMVRRGVLRCPSWFQEELNALDSHLRAWWDSYKEEWVIDRLQNETIVERLTRAAREEGNTDIAQAMEESATGLLKRGAYYLTILHFQPSPTLQLDRQLLLMLQKCDMQRFESPSAYMAEKRKEAAAVQKTNDAAANDKVLAAVDKLSKKQLDNFIAVETAIQSGETIVAHGADAGFLDRADKDKQRILKDAEARGQRISENVQPAMNPGMDPRIYKRQRKANR